MVAVANMWLMDRRQQIALAGAAFALLVILLNLGFFFRAGTSDVLRGFAYNGFVLGWLLVLTSGSRTVSLETLGIFWLVGVWAVFGAGYLVEDQLVSLFGADLDGSFVPVWLASFTEEGLKTLAVALFFLLACRGGYRRPSMSDGLLLGFVVGAGLKFHEDAHILGGYVTGAGWSAVTPLSTVFPTIESFNNLVYNDHALRGALEGLSVGVAAMLWHWRAARLIGLAGPALMFSSHVMWNYFVTEGTRDPPFLFSTLRGFLDSGELPLQVLLAGAVAAVVAELLILRWVGKRDLLFPPLPFARLLSMVKQWNTKAGLAQLLAAERYVTLRRSVYYSGWRTARAGEKPILIYADYTELVSLADRLDILPRGGAQSAPAVLRA